MLAHSSHACRTIVNVGVKVAIVPGQNIKEQTRPIAENISQLKWGAVKYGNFLAAVIKFLVIALVIFSMIKSINSLKKKEEAAPAAPSSTDKLLAEIRDELRRPR